MRWESLCVNEAIAQNRKETEENSATGDAGFPEIGVCIESGNFAAVAALPSMVRASIASLQQLTTTWLKHCPRAQVLGAARALVYSMLL